MGHRLRSPEHPGAAAVRSHDHLSDPTVGRARPDPDAPPRALADEAAAQSQAERLAAEGNPARVEAVAQPRSVDIAGCTLGYRVRVGSYPTKGAAERRLRQIEMFKHLKKKR